MMPSVLTRIIFFASMLKLLYANNGSIEIKRHNMSYTDGEWTYHPDTFKIPSRMCSSDISEYCGAMGGHSVGGCRCECNSGRTFGFYDDQWSCTANSKVRQHGGCSLVLLRDRTEKSALIPVPMNMQDDIPFEMPTIYERCYIIPYKSTFLLCNGSWEILDNNFVFSRFSMMEHQTTHFFTFNRTKKDFWYDNVKGRILRITIGCYNRSNAIIHNCLLLKMQGTMKCPQFSLPPILKPTTSPSTVPPTRKNEMQTHSSIPRTPLFKLTTVESSSTVYERKKNASKENDDGNTGLILGVAVGVICLTLIIVTIVIVAKRRRTKRNAAVTKSNKIVENVSYELGVDNSLKITDYNAHLPLDQDEYSYTYANNAVPLGRRNISNNARPADKQGLQTTVTNHLYGKVKNLDKHCSPSQTSAAPEYDEVYSPKNKNPSNYDGPRFNKKEGNQQKSRDQKEPFYHALEDPASLDGPLEGTKNEPPCYHVLEGPFSEGAPYYNVLEKPPSNETPEYRSLDGPNPGVYSALNRRDGSKKAVKQTHNYNDTVYDSVGEVINDTSDIYTNLDRNGRMQNINMYQALNKEENILNQHDLTSRAHSNS